MKATELMIGDWVLMRGTPVQVRAIGVNTIRYSDMLITEPLENIEPILLTPDILTKNGFEHKHNHNEGWLSLEEYPNWSVDIKADETPYRLIADNSTGVADIHDGIFVNKRINHVHELQHALRLCNIEKEIIL